MLKWIYTFWRYFWITFFSVLILVSLLIGVGLLLLQTESVQQRIAGELKKGFEGQFKGELHIGSISGSLPMDVRATDVFVVYNEYSDESENREIVQSDTVIAAKDIYLRPDWRQTIFNRFTISSLLIDEPQIKLNPASNSSGLTIAKAFERTEQPDVPKVETEKSDQGYETQLLPNFNLRELTVRDGTITGNSINRVIAANKYVQLPDDFTLDNIFLLLSLELSEEEQFLSFREFRGQTESFKFGEFLFRGQVYADQRFLEFNRISLRTKQSDLRFTAAFDGINIAAPGLGDQFTESTLNFRIDDSFVLTDEFTDLFPDLPDLINPVYLDLRSVASRDQIDLNRFELGYGESRVILYGEAEDILDELNYNLILDYVNLHYDDMRILFPDQENLFPEMNRFTVRGETVGSRYHADSELNLNSRHGNIEFISSLNWRNQLRYQAEIDIENLLLSEMPGIGMGNSRINALITAQGEGTNIEDATGRLEAKITNSNIKEYVLSDVQLRATIDDGFLEPEITINQSNDSRLRAYGWIDFLLEEPSINFEGTSTNFNPALLINSEAVKEGRLNSTFTLTATGSELDNFSGEVFLNLFDSDYDDEYIEEHEFYAFIDEPELETRTLRIGGTMLEAEITGSLIPSRLIETAGYWSKEIREKISTQSVYDLSDGVRVNSAIISDEMLENEISIRARIDDLSLLNKVFSNFPEIYTISNLDAKVSSSAEELSIEGQFFSDFIEMDGLAIDSLVIRSTNTYRKDRPTDFYVGRFEVMFGGLNASGLEFREADMLIDAYDEAFVLQRFKTVIGDDVELGAMMSAVFSDREVDIRIMDFFVGDEEYTWQNIGETPIRIDEGKRIHVNRLEFGNLQERFIIDGIFSENPEDSVSYLFSAIELERISNAISRRVNFSGVLDGTFFTRTIMTDPNFMGDLTVETLTLDNRLIGDIGFRSRFIGEDDRLETRLTIQTDPEQYRDYIEENKEVGQDIVIEGFVNSLGGISDEPDALIASFDVVMNEIDLWVLPLIVDGVFEEVEGRARGQGQIEIRRDGLHYDSRFEVIDVELVPVFLLARLIMNGEIGLNSRDGVVFTDVNVRDTGNGTGQLSGGINFEIGGGETVFDMRLDMNNLMFLNNRAGPEVPFYGRGVGTGSVRLAGTNDEPFISTPNPVFLSSNTVISIPVSSDQSVEGGTRFIQFVDDFDEEVSITNDDNRNGNGNGADNTNGFRAGREVDLTFMEKFELDLQFQADDNMLVRIIFDEVTSEILSARGTGRIRLALQDEVFQVFGRFDVAGGDYLFVGGDIFTRRFSIREGGTISWEGDPVNARIDVAASYRARPNINVLRPGQGDDTPQRTPVDLILNITGTLDSIENDFFFEFPTGTDITQSATILAIINDEDEKLLQATSILLSGNFVPRDTQLNDLFGSQFGAQGLTTLLSSQISNILNSNVSNVDIDLNMTGFEEADLGIALRLFDDRLTLRREGTVTGPNSNLGDFDVTYRINRYFSVEAFMRRESLLPSAVSVGQTQTNETYGVGLEARVQFNTWGELRERIWGSVRKLFTGKQKKEDEPSVATND